MYPQCPGCGHSYPGEKTCPECGYTLVSVRYRLIMLAIMVVLGAICVGLMIYASGGAEN